MIHEELNAINGTALKPDSLSKSMANNLPAIHPVSGQ